MNLINLNINSVSLSNIDEGNNYYFKTLTVFQIVLRGYMYAGCKEFIIFTAWHLLDEQNLFHSSSVIRISQKTSLACPAS